MFLRQALYGTMIAGSLVGAPVANAQSESAQKAYLCLSNSQDAGDAHNCALETLKGEARKTYIKNEVTRLVLQFVQVYPETKGLSEELLKILIKEYTILAEDGFTLQDNQTLRKRIFEIANELKI